MWETAAGRLRQALACKSPAPTSASVFTPSPCVPVSRRLLSIKTLRVSDWGLVSSAWLHLCLVHLQWLHLQMGSLLHVLGLGLGQKMIGATRQFISPTKEKQRTQRCPAFHCDLHSGSCSESQGKKKVVKLERLKPAAVPDDVTGCRERLTQMYRKPLPWLHKLFQLG